MSSSQSNNPQQICEAILIEGKRYNIEHSILPSENIVADRLLAYGLELKDAYEELHSKLHAHPPALEVFLQLILSTAAFWSPDKISEARTAREDLACINQQIARKAAQLASLLEQRSDLHNTSGFSSNTHYHVFEVIEAAAKDNYRFKSYVQERLRALRLEFDLKYWPSLSAFLRVLASDAEDARPEATDPSTAAATAIGISRPRVRSRFTPSRRPRCSGDKSLPRKADCASRRIRTCGAYVGHSIRC